MSIISDVHTGGIASVNKLWLWWYCSSWEPWGLSVFLDEVLLHILEGSRIYSPENICNNSVLPDLCRTTRQPRNTFQREILYFSSTTLNLHYISLITVDVYMKIINLLNTVKRHFLACDPLKKSSTQKWKFSRYLLTPHADWIFIVHKTFLGLHQKAALQHSPE